MRFLAPLRQAYKVTYLTYPGRNSFNYACAAVGWDQINTRCYGSKSSGNSKFFNSRKAAKKSKRDLSKYKHGSKFKWRSCRPSSNVTPVAMITNADHSQRIALIPVNLLGKDNNEDAFEEALTIVSLLMDNERQVELFANSWTELATNDRQSQSENTIDKALPQSNGKTPILNEFEEHDEATFLIEHNKSAPEVETDLIPHIPAVSFTTESNNLPRKIASQLREIPVSGMQLNFEMDMTNVKDALLNPNNLPALPSKRRSLENSTLALSTDVRLDSADIKTVPLQFNALIQGTVEVNPKEFSNDKLKTLKVPLFNEYVTAIAANLCSTALQRGFPTDVSRKFYSTQKTRPSENDLTVKNMLKRYDEFKNDLNARKAEMSKKKLNEGDSSFNRYQQDNEEVYSKFTSAPGLLDCGLYQKSLQAAARIKRKEASRSGSDYSVLSKSKGACKKTSSTPISGYESDAKSASKKPSLTRSKGPCKENSSVSTSGSKPEAKGSGKKADSHSVEKSPCRPCRTASLTSKQSTKSKGKSPCKKASALKSESDSPCKNKKASSASKSEVTSPYKKVSCASKNEAISPCNKASSTSKSKGTSPCKKTSSALISGSKSEGRSPCKKSSSSLNSEAKSPCKKASASKSRGESPCNKASSTSKSEGTSPCKKAYSASIGSKSKGPSPCKKASPPSISTPKPEAKDPCKKTPPDSGSQSKSSPNSKPHVKCGRPAVGDTRPKCKRTPPISKCGSMKPDVKDHCKKSSSASKSKETSPCKKASSASISGSKSGGISPCKKSSAGSMSPCKKASASRNNSPCKKSSSASISSKSKGPSPCTKASPSSISTPKPEAKDPCKKTPPASKSGSQSKSSPDIKCGRPAVGDTRPKCKRTPPISKCGSMKSEVKDPCKKSSSASKSKETSPCKKASSASITGSKSGGISPCKKSSAGSMSPCKKASASRNNSPCKKSSSASIGSKSKGPSPCKKASPSSISTPKPEAKDPCKKTPPASKSGSQSKSSPDIKCGRPAVGDTRPNCKRTPPISKCGSKSEVKDLCKRSSSTSKCGSKKGTPPASSDAKKACIRAAKVKCGSQKNLAKDEPSSIDKPQAEAKPSRVSTKPKCSNYRCPSCSTTRDTHTLTTLLAPFAVKVDPSSRSYSHKCPDDPENGYLPDSPRSNEYRRETCEKLSWKDTKHRKQRRNKPKNCYPDETQEFCPDTACYKVSKYSKKGKKKPKENEMRNDKVLCSAGKYNCLMFTSQRCHLSTNARMNQEAIIDEPYKISMRNHSIPRIFDNDILVAVDSVAISDSDIHMFETGARHYQEVTLGNEAAGVVQKIGRNVHHVKIGDHIAIESAIPCRRCDLCKRGHYNLCNAMTFNGCLSKYCIHPGAFCYKISKETPMERAAMIYQLALGCNASHQAGIRPNLNVAIIGSCAMTICAAICAHSMGASNICVMCGSPNAEDIVEEFVTQKVGCFDGKVNESELVERILVSLGTFPDIVINCSSCTKTMNAAIMSLKPAGTCVIAGFHSECASFNIMDALMKEIRIIPSYRSKNMFPLAINLLESGRAPVDGLIANCCRWDELEAAFRVALSEANSGPRKVIVQCQLGLGKVATG